MKNSKGGIQRFDFNQRIQHIVLFVCLIVLSLTGLALKFHSTFFGRILIKIEGGGVTRGLIHRAAALVFIGFCLFHVLYAIFSTRGHQELMNLKPAGKDLKGSWDSVRFNLGFSKKKPRFDRFSYKEKFQYWGVAFGSVLMILTGLILWAGTNFLNILPKWMLDLTFLIHGYEGVLLFILLFVWHIYNVHLSPDVFPMSKVWLTGKITLEELKKNHILEYERLTTKNNDE